MTIEKTSISKLFREAAKRLRSDFEYIRSSNPHSGEKGSEAEEILRRFLNEHMPRRFHAGSGIIIDNKNQISRQTDVIIYDALSSPLYRASERTQIVPVDTVACVIEVKSSLDKAALEDAYDKIVSCKQLAKTPFRSDMDQASTGSHLTTVETLGVIFGFDSKILLETLGTHLKELNVTHVSSVWPDMVVVLDRGVINYWASFPGDAKPSAELHNSCCEGYPIPPFYIHLSVVTDGEYALSRFFNRLLSQLTFYARRPSTVPFDIVLQGETSTLQTMEAYQYTTSRELKTVPKGMYLENQPPHPLSMEVFDEKGGQIGLMQYVPWQDGAVLRWYSPIPLQGILPLLTEKVEGIAIKQPSSDAQLSSVLKISIDDFKQWPAKLERKSNMKAKLSETSRNT